MPESVVYNEDCLVRMREYPDKHFALALVDPPYGLDKRLSSGSDSSKLTQTPMVQLYKKKSWDIKPDKEYWEQLFRITTNQIVFGGNYFIDDLFSSRGIVAWDKGNKLTTLSEWEFVWTSYDRVAKIFRCSSMDLQRFHPTQKPIELYKYMLTYARVKPEDAVLDTHLGSGGSRIVCWDFGLNFTGFELDEEYYRKQERRFKRHVNQGALFTREETLVVPTETLWGE